MTIQARRLYQTNTRASGFRYNLPPGFAPKSCANALPARNSTSPSPSKAPGDRTIDRSPKPSGPPTSAGSPLESLMARMGTVLDAR